MKWLVIAIAVLICAAPVFAEPSESQSGAGPSLSPVTWERLLNAADEPENWLMYSGTLDSQRFSGLDQIHKRNVGELELTWAYHLHPQRSAICDRGVWTRGRSGQPLCGG